MSRVLSPIIKLSSPATRDFWEVPVLFEDDHLLALNKPARVLTSPDHHHPDWPDMMTLLHRGIAEEKEWVRERTLAFLANAHRLDFVTTGVLLLAKNKAALVNLTNQFGAGRPLANYIALVQGTPAEDRFEVSVPLGPHPRTPGLMAVNLKSGKKAKTEFQLLEKFRGYSLLKCQPLTERPHQVRVHLRWVKLPIAGDTEYRGSPLLLSELKRNYCVGKGKEERPLISTAALHAEDLQLQHPVTNEELTIAAPRPKDLEVALKYLRRFAS